MALPVDEFSVRAELERGGTWLGAARNWMQWSLPGSSELKWAAHDPVSVPFCKLENLALVVAVAAVQSERTEREREGQARTAILRLQMENEKLRMDNARLLELSRGDLFLPEGAQRFTQHITSAGVLGFESVDGVESLQLALPDGPGVFHVVFVREVTGG
jgi:hypothetical protein